MPSARWNAPQIPQRTEITFDRADGFTTHTPLATSRLRVTGENYLLNAPG